MNRINVLQIVAGLDVGNTFGGAERSGLELALALDSAQFAVTVCSFWQCGTAVERAWQEKLERAGIPLFFATPLAAQRNSMDFFAGAKHIVNWCRDHPIDIIHAHHEGGALTALWAKASAGARVALRTTHVPLGNEWGTGVVNGMLRASMSHVVFPLFLDAEVSISQERCDMLNQRWMARWLRRHADLIHNALPLVAQAVQPRLQQPPVIGCVARLSAEKGVDRLLNAMPAVLAARPDAKLLIAGDGPLRTDLQALARRLGIHERVHFFGQCDDVPALLKQMSVFVLPSLYEGVSTALLEAIAAGVPAVASDIAGNRAIINDGRAGWLVDAAQPAIFANAIIAALANPIEAAQRAATAQQVLAEYTPEVSIQTHTALYNRLIVRRPPNGARH